MLDDGECSEAVHFQFVNPIGIIERRNPLQERHWLEIHQLPFTAFTRIMICGTHFGANSRIAGFIKARDSPFCVAQTTLRMSTTQPAHLLVKSPEFGRADYHIRGLPLRSCRRKPHRRGPSPVVWKVRKVQRKGFLSMWPRCPCIPAIDRRQFSEADNYANCERLYAHLRESGCRVRCAGCQMERRVGGEGAIAMQCVSRLMPTCSHTGSN